MTGFQNREPTVGPRPVVSFPRLDSNEHRRRSKRRILPLDYEGSSGVIREDRTLTSSFTARRPGPLDHDHREFRGKGSNLR